MESDAATTTAAAAAEAAGCYGGGDIAGAVIGSLIGGIVLAYVLYRLYTHYWRNRKGEYTSRRASGETRVPPVQKRRACALIDLSRGPGHEILG